MKFTDRYKRPLRGALALAAALSMTFFSSGAALAQTPAPSQAAMVNCHCRFFIASGRGPSGVTSLTDLTGSEVVTVTVWTSGL